MQLASEWRIYRVDLDGSPPEPIALPAGSLINPAVSRDGRRLAYVREGGEVGLFVLDSGDAMPRKVYPDAAVDHISWSPSGEQLVLGLPWWGAGPGAGGLRVVSLVDTTTRDIAADLSEPAWSPDGHSILAAPGQSPLSERISGIYAVTMADTTPHLVVMAEGARSPAWSPDGGRIAFTLGPYGASFIYTSRPDGSDRRQLTSRADSTELVTDLMPAWAPGGSQIAFQREHRVCEGEACVIRYDIFVIGVNGSGLRNLTKATAWGGVRPTW